MRAETGGAAGIRKRILGVLDLGEGGQGGGVGWTLRLLPSESGKWVWCDGRGIPQICGIGDGLPWSAGEGWSSGMEGAWLWGSAWRRIRMNVGKVRACL